MFSNFRFESSRPVSHFYHKKIESDGLLIYNQTDEILNKLVLEMAERIFIIGLYAVPSNSINNNGKNNFKN